MNARIGSVPHDLAGSLSPDQYERWQENRKNPMRNLEQYPITTDEIIRCLTLLMDDVSYEKTGLVGDMRPLLLANAIQLISASGSAQCALYREALDKALDVAHEKMNKMDNLPGEAPDAFNLACEAAQSALSSTER